MKKHFTLLTGLLLGIGAPAFAQTTVFAENFEGTTIGSLPTGWTQQSESTGGWKTHEGRLDFSGTSFFVPKHSRYIICDDWTNPTAKNDSSFLIMPSINLTGISNAYLKMNYYFVGASRSNVIVEKATVRVSTDGGTTWNTIQTLTGDLNWKTSYISLAAYDNQPNVMISLGYYDAASQLLGLAIDDVRVYTKGSDEATLAKINLPQFMGNGIAINGSTVGLVAENSGTAAITSFDATYIVDGGTPVSQRFAGLNIAPGATKDVTFSTALSGITPGNHNLVVTIDNVNTHSDPYTDDNTMSAAFMGAGTIKPRPCLIEEFTSSTCPPCAAFNVTFDPLIIDNEVNKPASNFNIIKYQMNWPSPGNDAAYNAHGNTRKNYYGVTGIPDHYTHGLAGGSGDQSEIDACKGGITPFEITGSYTVVKDSLKVQVAVTPFVSLTGDFSVHIAAVEKEYVNNKATTSQKDYFHVMRLMFPNGSGTKVSSWTDGSAQDMKYAAKFTAWSEGTEVKQNSYTFFSHPMNSNMVVFVQDNATKEILQSAVIPASWPTSVEEKSAGMDRVDLYPNPATNQTNVYFTLNAASDMNIRVTDVTGRVVFTVTEKQMAAGAHTMALPTDNLNAGMYHVTIQSDKGAVVKTLSVIK